MHDQLFDDLFIVACMNDGRYVLATRQAFTTLQDAENYARTVAPSRFPLVVSADRWLLLRDAREIAYE